MMTVGDLLSSRLQIVNLGLESFAVELERMGVAVIRVQWSPPASGDVRRAALLATLADDEDEEA